MRTILALLPMVSYRLILGPASSDTSPYTAFSECTRMNPLPQCNGFKFGSKAGVRTFQTTRLACWVNQRYISLQPLAITWGRIALSNGHRFRGSHLQECVELVGGVRGYSLYRSTPLSSKLRKETSMPYSRRNLKKKGTKVSLKQNNRLKFRKGKFGSEAVQVAFGDRS